MNIRRAVLKDCKAVYDLCNIPGLLNPNGEHPRFVWIEAFVKENQTFFVAEDKKKIIGFVLGERTCGDVGYLWMLAVKKEFQGKGVGGALFSKAEEDFLKRKMKVIFLYGHNSNKTAIEMFKKRGYSMGNSLYSEFIKFL